MLETERLRLRPLGVADADLWFALHSDPRVNRFVGPYSREHTVERLRRVERQWEERGHGLCAVYQRSDGAFVGRTGLNYWADFDETEIGWTLAAAYWGHGYATEAARACLDWGFATLDLDYVTAMIHPDNAASFRVAERLGFTRLRDDVLLGSPVVVLALHRPETP
ncbi:GNAT family N-acetyltransferase [Streptomyces sp. B6B3]|uniref:GNAT family N-acetyltransferase n=1 Tax=Streptomyces sp. B6B3 TaxID=3153570 RepID=UPI00325CE3C4